MKYHRTRNRRPGRRDGMQIRTRTPVRVHPSGRRRLGKLISPEELEFITAICPGYNLGKAYKRVTREYEQEFRDSNLSLAQFALLVNIGRREPASGTEIANRLGSDLSTLSRTIDLLVKRGLVCQKRGEDRRVRVYCLTDAGHAALAEVIPKWRQATRRTLSGIEGSRWRRVLRDLRGLSA